MSKAKTYRPSEIFRRLAVPFGRYVGNSEGSPDTHRTLVGREGQRIAFGDLLLNHGPNGAFLVTGQRGAGKTSFVRECLRQYENDVYVRVLRSDVGRAVYWDRIFFLSVGALGIALLMMAHELLNALVLMQHDSAGPHLWLAILPLVVICGMPIIYALRLFAVFIESRGWHRVGPRAFASTLFTAAMALVFSWGLPIVPHLSSSPDVIMSRVLVMALTSVVVTQHLSVRSVSEQMEPGSAPAFMGGVLSNTWKYSIPIAAAFVAPIAIEWVLIIQLDMDVARLSYWLNVSFAFGLVTSFLVLNAGLTSPGGHSVRGYPLYCLGWLFSLVGWLLSLPRLAKWSLAWPARPDEVTGVEEKHSRERARLRSDWYWIGIIVCTVAAIVSFWFGARDLVGQGDENTLKWVLAIFLMSAFAPPCIALGHSLAIRYLNIHLDQCRDAPHDDFTTAWERFNPWERFTRRRAEAQAQWIQRNAGTSTNIKVISFASQPLLILLAKSVAACVLGVQLAAPMLNEMVDFLVGQSIAPRARLLDGHWFLAAFLFAIAIARVEYEWIVAPYAWLRDDRARDVTRWVEANPDEGSTHQQQAEFYLKEQSRHLRYVRHTLHWLFYSNWIQVIVVHINLGFDKLEHTHVVHAMLAGLRDLYRRRFLSPLGAVAVVSAIIKLLVVVIIATILSEAVFGTTDENVDRIEDGQLAKDLESSDALRLIDDHPRVVEFLYYPVIGSGGSTTEGGLVLCMVLPCVSRDVEQRGVRAVHVGMRASVQKTANQRSAQYAVIRLYSGLVLCMVLPCVSRDVEQRAVHVGMHAAVLPTTNQRPAQYVVIRVYNVVVFILVFVVISLVIRRLEITPYQPLLNEINGVLHRLTGKTGVVTHSRMLSVRGALGEIALPQEVHSREVEQADPRAIEDALIRILGEIRHPRLALFPSRRLHLPAPEVTFVFDELDKVGMRVSRPSTLPDPKNVHDAIALDADGVRSLKINQLFAEMKNLLSSAPARFIMVGGRDLHDEWPVDQASPTPLLTSIFRGVIYLPSLLVDQPPGPTAKRWRNRIAEYVTVQYQRSQVNFETLASERERPGFGLGEHTRLPLAFVQPMRYLDDDDTSSSDGPFREIACCDSETELSEAWRREINDAFVEFLTQRSMGNPKKLKELLESFVRPTGRYVSAGLRWKGVFGKCEHILMLSDDELFRVQLVSSLYRQLRDAFEKLAIQREDRHVNALFYFSDFLFKFHRRAFSWWNLERAHEQAARRYPGHRVLLESIVFELSERMLHPILNGLYAFRFRSDVACEIAYISRRSKEEMAAFNFTHDESHSLKERYRGYMTSMKSEEAYDVISGIGELHDFDQDFELARHYYARAVTEGDSKLGQFSEGDFAGIDAVLACGPRAMQFMRQHLEWCTNRLRIMLQIGLTFEMSRNLERASVVYRDARTLARCLLRAYLDNTGRMNDRLWDRPFAERFTKSRRTHSLKHLNIIYQATFAEAWAAEKMTEAVDTSITLVERELYGFRHMLPFVREARPESEDAISGVSPVKAAHSNFSLSMAEIHSKAGDLYFFKGRQHVDPIYINEESRRAEGYLQCAQFHYAMCIHDLRRYVSFRIGSSWKRLNIYTGTYGQWATLESKGWSDFMFRALGGAFGDLVDSILGQVSFFGVIKDLGVIGNACYSRQLELDLGLPSTDPVTVLVETLTNSLTAWLEGHSSHERLWGRFVGLIDREFGLSGMGPLRRWLGEVKIGDHGDVWASDGAWLAFEEPGTDIQRLVFALLLSASAAEMLVEGGYPEDAARELLQVAETVHHWMSWASGLADLPKDALHGSEGWRAVAKDANLDGSWGCRFWCFMVDLSVYALERAWMLGAGRGHDPRLGDYVPVEMVYSVCALGLAANSRRWSPSRQQRLDRLIGQVASVSSIAAGEQVEQKSLRRMTIDALHRYRYPALARLRGIKLLIDDAAVHCVSNSSVSASSSPNPRFRLHVCGARSVDMQETRLWMRELVDLEEQLQAPLHFTPMHMGVTLAQICLRDAEVLREYGASALAYLDASLEVTTMRRAYYEAISDLYYLHDDFNDSQIHYNHAIQMAGYQYVLLLREAVEAKLKPKRAQPWP